MIAKLKAHAIKKGYITEHGLCVGFTKHPPYIALLLYKDSQTIYKVFHFNDDILAMES